MPTTSRLLGELRAATADAHAELERLPCFVRLLAPTLALDEYLEILRRFWRFHAQQEARVDAAVFAAGAAAALELASLEPGPARL